MRIPNSSNFSLVLPLIESIKCNCVSVINKDVPFARAYSCSLATVVAPILRLGTLIIRNKLKSSKGLYNTRKYAKTSLISLRS